MKHFATLPGRIWQRQDLMLVAAGALSCVRTIYLQAVKTDKLHQFRPCLITRGEYASGRAEARLGECLRQAASYPGVGGIVIYASCAEVAMQLDWERAIFSAGLPEALPVKVLLRGPLVARTRVPEADLERLLAELPPSRSAIQKGVSPPLPPLPPDFCGAASLLREWNTTPYLLTPGGCASCVTQADGDNPLPPLAHTRFDDLELASGCEESAAAGIAADMEKHGTKACALLGSSVPSLIGLDDSAIQAGLNRRGLSVVYLDCNGFEAAQVGIAKALVQSVQRWHPQERTAGQKTACILGYSELAFGSASVLRFGRETLERGGYRVELWRGEGPMPAVNWVVSAEGLPAAQVMKRDFGIPYLCGLPLDRDHAEDWREWDALCPAPPRDQGPDILLVGQPTITQGLALTLNGKTVRRAYYAPSAGLRELFAPFAEDGSIVFSNIRELRDRVEPPRLILADPLLLPCLTEVFPASASYSCPDHTVSERRYLSTSWSSPGGSFWDGLWSAIEKIDIQQ